MASKFDAAHLSFPVMTAVHFIQKTTVGVSRLMRTVTLLVCCVAVLSVQAEVYRAVDKNGNITYSDTPSANSKRTYVQPVQTISAPKPAASKKDAPQPETLATPGTRGAEIKKPKVVRYKLRIVSPEDGQTVRQNAGTVSVDVSVKPALQQGDLLQFSLNGAPAGDASASTSTTLTFVDRGTHSIGAKVVTASGNTKATAKPVTMHLKRFFITN